jgi:hypothetical protein
LDIIKRLKRTIENAYNVNNINATEVGVDIPLEITWKSNKTPKRKYELEEYLLRLITKLVIPSDLR